MFFKKHQASHYWWQQIGSDLKKMTLPCIKVIGTQHDIFTTINGKGMYSASINASLCTKHESSVSAFTFNASFTNR